MSFNGDIKSLNNALNIRGTLEAPVPLNVFIALDLTTDSGKAFVLWGVGTLQAGVPSDSEIHLPTSINMGSGHYEFHVFTDGAELLNSMMDSTYIENQLEALARNKSKASFEGRDWWHIECKRLPSLLHSNLRNRTSYQWNWTDAQILYPFHGLHPALPR